jgi:signal peptidase II
VTEATVAPPRRRLGTVATVAAVILALDQLTKWWAVRALSDGDQVDLIGSLRLRLSSNTGAAFSIGDGRNLGPLIALLALAVVGFLVSTGDSTRRRLGAVAVGMVAGGAVGNLADRAFRDHPGSGLLGGAVIDFIDLQWWPVFNVADASIVVGAITLVAASLRPPPPAHGT